MIDGGRTVAQVGNVEICLYEAMRDMAAQFAAGDMSKDEFLDALECMTDDAAERRQDYAHA